jgi:uncharacterized RDD family membrane protein YckC
MSEENLLKLDGHDLRPWKRRTEAVRLSGEFVQLPEKSDQSPLYCGFRRRFAAHFIDCFAMASLGALGCIAVGVHLPTTFIAVQHVAVLFGYFGLCLWFTCDFVPGLALCAFLLALAMWVNFAFAYGFNIHAAPLHSLFLLGCLPFILDLLYRTICESSPARATLGKRLMRVYVADLKGNRLTFQRALMRNAAKSFLLPAFILGPISILWTRRKQAHHDALVETVVLNNVEKADQRKLLR